MPVPKSEFEQLPPCDFYTPEDLFEPDQMYTVYEVARLLQGADPDAELDPETEAILLDWAIPWIMTNADDLVVAEPRTDDEPGYYGLKEDGGAGGESADDDADADGDETADENEGEDANADE